MFFCRLPISESILLAMTWYFSFSASSLRRSSLVSSRTWRVLKRVVKTRRPSLPSEYIVLGTIWSGMGATVSSIRPVPSGTSTSRVTRALLG